jgi:hypothetical protein
MIDMATKYADGEVLFSAEIPQVDQVSRARARVLKVVGPDLGNNSRIGWANLALAFPNSVGGQSYAVEIGQPRQWVGHFTSTVIYGWSASSLHYGVMVLSDNSSLELYQTDGSASVWRDGVKSGTIFYRPASKAEARFARGSWDLIFEGNRFGVVKPGVLVTTTNLAIQCNAAFRLPLRLGREARFSEFLRVIWRMLSLRFLYTPSPPNDDYVMDPESANRLTESEATFYFGAAMYFRAMVFWLGEGAG